MMLESRLNQLESQESFFCSFLIDRCKAFSFSY